MSLHFIRPEWLLALLPLALLLVLLWKTKGRRSAWQTYIAPHLTQVLLTQNGKRASHRLVVLSTLWIVGAIAMAGPAVTKTPLPVFSSAQGRVIIMDMSKSMYATDLAPNRLTQEKFRATDLINNLKDGETALIAYAGDAFTISPMTTDRQTLLNLLPTLSPDIMPVQGSNLASAIALAKQLLAQSGHQKGDIVLLTDGVRGTQYDDALAELKDTQYRLGVLALGTSQGAPIRLPGGQLQRDNAGEVVVAKTDFGLLGKLASHTGGVMLPFNPDGSDVQTLTNWLDKDAGNAKATDIQGENWQDLGPYLAVLLLIPVLWSFRGGILASVALVAFIQPQPAQAADWWQDLWQTPNQQAQSAFDNKAYQDAANLFEDSNWRGSAHYKAGEYDKALSEFQRDETAIGKFNQGNARMQLNQLDKAIEDYQAALQQDPDFADAKANLELAEKLKKQQQQSQQGQQDQQNQQEQQDQQNQQGQQDQQNQQGQQDQQNQQGQQGQQNEAQMQADAAQMSEQQKQQQTAQAQAAQMQTEMDEAAQGESQASIASSQLSADPLPEDMQRALRAVADDPSVLLRNKMLLEYEKRRMRGEQPKGSEQW